MNKTVVGITFIIFIAGVGIGWYVTDLSNRAPFNQNQGGEKEIGNGVVNPKKITEGDTVGAFTVEHIRTVKDDVEGLPDTNNMHVVFTGEPITIEARYTFEKNPPDLFGSHLTVYPDSDDLAKIPHKPDTKAIYPGAPSYKAEEELLSQFFDEEEAGRATFVLSRPEVTYFPSRGLPVTMKLIDVRDRTVTGKPEDEN
jgi:hypothetical protein